MISTSMICLESPWPAWPNIVCVYSPPGHHVWCQRLLFLFRTNCHVPGQQGLTAVLARDTIFWLLIGHWSNSPASDWPDVSGHCDACQTRRLLSVMYRPLRRHTYHSVTNNTNNSETILSSRWSEAAHAASPLVRTITSTTEVRQKVNKHSQLGLAAFDFIFPFFWFIGYLEVWSHCWATRRRVCWGWSLRKWGTSWGRWWREEGRRVCGANSDSCSVVAEASQSLLIT